MASFFVKSGGIIRLTSKEATVTYETLPVGTYLVQYHKEIGFYLEQMESGPLPKKIYGSHQKDADRIMQTFLGRPHSTGALLVGDKGSGKTMLTRLISHDAAARGIPTLVINQPYTGDSFNNFLNEISQTCVVLFDEFEKVYDKDKQPLILTLMDGIFSGQKLYMLTANDKFKIDIHMKNRPGRLFYMLEYRGLEQDFIRQYCEDRLENKSNIEGVCAIVSLFQDFNFDMLQALIEEMNRYGETANEALRLLNVKPELDGSSNYSVKLIDPDGGNVDLTSSNRDEWRGNPMLATVGIVYGIGPKDKDGDYEDYESQSFTMRDITQMDAKTNTIVFKNDAGYLATLTKIIPKPFDFRNIPNGSLAGSLL